MYKRQLEYCTHGATCDNTGTSGCRTEHHNACSCLTLHAVRDGAVLDAGNAEEVLLCFLEMCIRDRVGEPPRRGPLVGVGIVKSP